MRLHTFREINKNVTEIYQKVLKLEIAISPRSGITLRAWLSSSLNLLYESLGGRILIPTGPRERKSSGSGNVNKPCFPITLRLLSKIGMFTKSLNFELGNRDVRCRDLGAIPGGGSRVNETMFGKNRGF